MIITEVGKQCCSPKDHGTRCAIGLYVRGSWTTDQMKSRKNANKGVYRTLKYSNGLELQFHDYLQLHGYFSRYVRGYSAKISWGWTDRQVVNAGLGTINVLTCLMTMRHKKVN